MHSRDILTGYGMQEIATVTLPCRNRFLVEINQANASAWTYSIYAFLIGDEICRIGSSKGLLGNRLRNWSRDLTARLQDMESPSKMATTAVEATKWRARLEEHQSGWVFARPGTQVQTPVGVISAYLDEESVLIGRHRPALNNSMHR